jgi:hypothetical protein
VRRCCSAAAQGGPRTGGSEAARRGGLAWAAVEGKPWCGQVSVLVEAEQRLWHGELEGEAAKRRWRPGITSSEEPRCRQTRRTSFTHAEVGARATRRGFDAQRKTGGGGRPALMASQQEGRTAELQDLEVWAELNWRVRGCERKCFARGRLGLIPQACAHAGQQATREQVEGQGCGSRTGIARKRCNQARRSCRRLRGCAGRVSAAHVREQRRLSS